MAETFSSAHHGMRLMLRATRKELRFAHNTSWKKCHNGTMGQRMLGSWGVLRDCCNERRHASTLLPHPGLTCALCNHIIVKGIDIQQSLLSSILLHPHPSLFI